MKGGGFRTGIDQPQAMYEILEGFLAGKTLPYKNVWLRYIFLNLLVLNIKLIDNKFILSQA